MVVIKDKSVIITKVTEHFTWGIVLQKEPVGESDSEYIVFTWDVGKVRARATSSRKTLSRLAGHLEPGTLATIRIVRKNEGGKFRMTEALSESKTKSLSVIKILALADTLIPLEQPDLEMFSLLKTFVTCGIDSEPASYAKLLKCAGFNPKAAKCGICTSTKIAYFSPQDIIFLCTSCQKQRINQ